MIYFDNAATTFPKPNSVIESVNSAIINYGGNPGRGGHKYSMRASEKIYEVRKKIALFFNTQPQNIIFTTNCTMSLNIAIKGVLKQGDHVITSCLEHNSVIRPLHKLSLDGKITYDIAKIYDDENQTISNSKSLIKDNTKLIICTHASNVSGTILPIKQIGDMCREKGIIFIVDAAQSAGVIPIDIQKMNINILCTAGHKGLYGITGTGLLAFKDDIVMDTIIEGGTGSLSVELEQPDFFPDKLESGTLNTVGILSMGAGIDFIKEMSLETIYKHEFKMCQYVYDNIKYLDNVKLYVDNYSLYNNAPIIAFNIKNMMSDVVVDYLDKNGFALRGGLHCSPLAHERYGTLETGMVRFSPSIFTKQQSVEEFVKIIQGISKKSLI